MINKERKCIRLMRSVSRPPGRKVKKLQIAYISMRPPCFFMYLFITHLKKLKIRYLSSLQIQQDTHHQQKSLNKIITHFENTTWLLFFP